LLQLRCCGAGSWTGARGQIATRDKCTTTSPSARGVRTCSMAQVMEAVDTAGDTADCDEDGITLDDFLPGNGLTPGRMARSRKLQNDSFSTLKVLGGQLRLSGEHDWRCRTTGNCILNRGCCGPRDQSTAHAGYVWRQLCCFARSCTTSTMTRISLMKSSTTATPSGSSARGAKRQVMLRASARHRGRPRARGLRGAQDVGYEVPTGGSADGARCAVIDTWPAPTTTMGPARPGHGCSRAVQWHHVALQARERDRSRRCHSRLRGEANISGTRG
jgi:hypothetical protein